MDKVFKRATFNSSKDEFYSDYRLTVKQRTLLNSCENYRYTANGITWEVNFSSRWSDQLPVYFYGQSHSLD